MLEAILDALCARLVSAGINAVRSFPSGRMGSYSAPVVTVSVAETKSAGSGAGDYLGTARNSETLEETEIYGFRLETVFALDIWSARDGGRGAAGCEESFGDISAAVSDLPSGLKFRALSRGETAFDRDTEMFRCPVRLECLAYVYGERDADADEFTDFILKGELGNADQ